MYIEIWKKVEQGVRHMNKPKIGLALGAGAARGLAHIGVLKILTEEKIPINYLAGTSIGGIIGGFYASGIDIYQMEKLALHLHQINWFDLTIPKLGLAAGNKAHELFTLLTKGKKFSDLATPLAIVATDLERGEKVTLTEGCLADAMRATSSIPGIFQPFTIGDRMLVDGAVTERVPTQVVREMGADIVIGVDVRFNVSQPKIKGIFGVIMQSIEILEKQVAEKSIIEADILISPNTEEIGPSKFDKAKECIVIGEEATKEALPQIKKLLSSWKG